MSAPISTDHGQEPLTALPPDLHPSVEHLVTEDDTPVDNVYAEKQQRLLTHPLYSSWPGPGEDRPFIVLSNVGLFYSVNEPPLVPDCLLSLDVRIHPDVLKEKKHRSYFTWEFGKVPEVVIEVVSNKEGEELGSKKQKYAQIGIPIYVVWDPMEMIGRERLQIFVLQLRHYQRAKTSLFSEVGLGLKVWHGEFENMEEDWLRWCDRDGNVILTGREAAALEKRRADEEAQRAEQADQRAQQADQRAEQADQRAKRLAAQLRKLGVEPENGNG